MLHIKMFTSVSLPVSRVHRHLPCYNMYPINFKHAWGCTHIHTHIIFYCGFTNIMCTLNVHIKLQTQMHCTIHNQMCCDRVRTRIIDKLNSNMCYHVNNTSNTHTWTPSANIHGSICQNVAYHTSVDWLPSHLTSRSHQAAANWLHSPTNANAQDYHT